MARARLFRSFAVLGLLLALFVAAAVVWLWWRSHHVPARMLRLQPVSFAALPGWADADPRGGLDAFRRSCAVILKQPADAAMGGIGYAGTARQWQSVCRAMPASGVTEAAARAFFENNFAPGALSFGGDPAAFFTGYYEPQLRGSRTRHGAYQTPVYGVPDDLIGVDLGQFRVSLKGEQIEGRLTGHKLVPYSTRAQIDANGIGDETPIIYLDDPASAFFLHIQGSGRVTLDDGTVERLAYAGQNGRPYTAIGRTLIANGALKRGNVTMQSIRAWLLAHPAQARGIMESDQSYVFFSLEKLGDPALGSKGSEGVNLTPRASLAVDPRFYALGVPLWIATAVPSANMGKPDETFDRLMVAQDTGGAIRGPLRGDVYWGFGADAESHAGRMKAHGRMFLLLPKPLAQTLAPYKDYAAR